MCTKFLSHSCQDAKNYPIPSAWASNINRIVVKMQKIPLILTVKHCKLINFEQGIQEMFRQNLLRCHWVSIPDYSKMMYPAILWITPTLPLSELYVVALYHSANYLLFYLQICNSELLQRSGWCSTCIWHLKVRSNRACIKVSHNALLWKFQAYSVNERIIFYDFEWAIGNQKLPYGNAVNMLDWMCLYPTCVIVSIW